MDYDVFYDDEDGQFDGGEDLQDYYDEEELDELLKAYQDNYFGDEEDFSRMPLSQLFDNCIVPTITQTLQMLAPLFAVCLIFRLVCLLSRSAASETGVPRTFIHVSSAIFGLLTINYFFGATIVYPLICCFSVYVILMMTSMQCRHLTGVSVTVFVVIYIVVCELFVVDATSWHSVRGTQIILSMKVIGLGFDITNGQVSLPDVSTYLGYCFSVGTVIFGPWISFQDYMNVEIGTSNVLDVRWIFKVMKSSVIGICCLEVSTCVVNWIVLQNYDKWIVAYKDAQSFRFSHYFVCFISEATTTLSGIGCGDLKSWNLAVSRPQHIEIPRSLVSVVTHWNLPMHHWLKTYVFKVARPYGTFLAVMLTYAASSLLHGLNFQLGAVLFSLGFYTYVEYVLRNRLSKIYSACILAKSCGSHCEHTHKNTHPYVILTNIGFGMLSMFHLAYLGLMFDTSSQQEQGYTMSHTLEKWANLGYLSHMVVLGTYMFYLII